MKEMFARYFGPGDPAGIDDARQGLLNPAITPETFAGGRDFHQSTVLEQYKIYVEMADRVSARRSLTNAFFLTLNSSIFVIIGVFAQSRATGPTIVLLFPTIVLVGQCLAWFWILRSYRQLNSGKYAVVGALEEHLPVRPYWFAEWKALGEGRRKERYWPLTHLEQWVPVLFAVCYVGGFIVALML